MKLIQCGYANKETSEREMLNPEITKIELLFLLSSFYSSPCKLVSRIWCEIKSFNFYLISLSILITCLLDYVWILYGEVTF